MTNPSSETFVIQVTAELPGKIVETFDCTSHAQAIDTVERLERRSDCIRVTATVNGIGVLFRVRLPDGRWEYESVRW